MVVWRETIIHDEMYTALTLSTYSVYPQARSTHHHPDHAAVLVTVTGVDDNPLVFTRSHFIGRVAENSPIGTTVLRVQATDNDKVGVVTETSIIDHLGN